jgi:hypothetical protein
MCDTLSLVSLASQYDDWGMDLTIDYDALYKADNAKDSEVVVSLPVVAAGALMFFGSARFGWFPGVLELVLYVPCVVALVVGLYMYNIRSSTEARMQLGAMEPMDSQSLVLAREMIAMHKEHLANPVPPPSFFSTSSSSPSSTKASDADQDSDNDSDDGSDGPDSSMAAAHARSYLSNVSYGLLFFEGTDAPRLSDVSSVILHQLVHSSSFAMRRFRCICVLEDEAEDEPCAENHARAYWKFITPQQMDAHYHVQEKDVADGDDLYQQVADRLHAPMDLQMPLWDVCLFRSSKDATVGPCIMMRVHNVVGDAHSLVSVLKKLCMTRNNEAVRLRPRAMVDKSGLMESTVAALAAKAAAEATIYSSKTVSKSKKPDDEKKSAEGKAKAKEFVPPNLVEAQKLLDDLPEWLTISPLPAYEWYADPSIFARLSSFFSKGCVKLFQLGKEICSDKFDSLTMMHDPFHRVRGGNKKKKQSQQKKLGARVLRLAPPVELTDIEELQRLASCAKEGREGKKKKKGSPHGDMQREKVIFSRADVLLSLLSSAIYQYLAEKKDPALGASLRIRAQVPHALHRRDALSVVNEWGYHSVELPVKNNKKKGAGESKDGGFTVLERMELVHQRMQAALTSCEAYLNHSLEDIVTQVLGVSMAQKIRMQRYKKHSVEVVFVNNTPAESVLFAGHTIVHLYGSSCGELPHFTFVSYNGAIGLSLVCDETVMPDADRLIQLFDAEVANALASAKELTAVGHGKGAASGKRTLSMSTSSVTQPANSKARSAAETATASQGLRQRKKILPRSSSAKANDNSSNNERPV